MFAWHNAFCAGIPHQSISIKLSTIKLSQHSWAQSCCCVLPGACRGALWLHCWNWSVRLIDDQSLMWGRSSIAQGLTGCLAYWLTDWVGGCPVIFFFYTCTFLVASVCLQAPPRRSARSSWLRPGRGRERSRSGSSAVCGGKESAPSSVHRPESAFTCSVKKARIN